MLIAVSPETAPFNPDANFQTTWTVTALNICPAESWRANVGYRATLLYLGHKSEKAS
jgi:hypothetical protein